MTVIANSTPLIYLAAIGKLDLLQALFGHVLIPEAVYNEVVVQGSNQSGAVETARARWIERRQATGRNMLAGLQSHLDMGESEVIVLAEELNADLVIMDESAGRRELGRRGIRLMGTVGLLIQAKQRGLISALKPELDRLRECGFHLSDRVYRKCLADVGE